jgi:trehalose 2-sulfotransferase
MRRRSADHPAGSSDEGPQKITAGWFDFPGPVPLRRAYLIASTPRCGSTFLTSVLWQTGVLGAPAEYWNFHKRVKPVATGIKMMQRLDATSPDDYLNKLLACRTTRNGIFGVKVLFVQFSQALKRFPQVLERLAPLTYIYIEREDKVAQAVSLAKLAQHGGWPERRGRAWQARSVAVPYDRDMISLSLARLEQQTTGWRQWFETNKIDPFVVKYEKLAADQNAVVRSIKELLGAQDDEPQEVRFKAIERQGDSTNREWVARYKSEVAGNGAAMPVTQRARDHDQQVSGHLFDRLEQIRSAAPAPKSKRTLFLTAARTRRRYEGIIASNRELFRNARVLDVNCGDGCWSLAALDAGAVHVTGLERRRKLIEFAAKVFAEYGQTEDSYRLIREPVIAGLTDFEVGSFDVILCQDLAEIADPCFFFGQLRRLRPKHVILDVPVRRMRAKRSSAKPKEEKQPRAVAAFRLPNKRKDRSAAAPGRRSPAMTFVPNHNLVAALSEHFGFRLNKLDWRSLGLVDWVGMTDYELESRQTYVLGRP